MMDRFYIVWVPRLLVLYIIAAAVAGVYVSYFL